MLAVAIAGIGSIWTGSGQRAEAADVPAGFVDEQVLGGLELPTNVAFASDGRVFVAEKSGIIRVFDSLSDPTPSVFADLRTEVFNFGDLGMTGLALHPNFPATPYVYVTYVYDAPIGGTAPTYGVAGETFDNCTAPTDRGCLASGQRLRLTRRPGTRRQRTRTRRGLVPGGFRRAHDAGSALRPGRHALCRRRRRHARQIRPTTGSSATPATTRRAARWLRRPPKAAHSVPGPAYAGRPRRARRHADSDRPEHRCRSARQPTRRERERERTPDRRARPPQPLPLHVASGHRGDLDRRRRLAQRARRSTGSSTRPTARSHNFGWPCFEAGHETVWDASDLNICETCTRRRARPRRTSRYRHVDKVSPGGCDPGNQGSVSSPTFYTGNSFPAEYHGAFFFGDYACQCLWVMFPGANGLPDTSTVASSSTEVGGIVDMEMGPGGDLSTLTSPTERSIGSAWTGGTNRPPTAMAHADPTSERRRSPCIRRRHVERSRRRRRSTMRGTSTATARSTTAPCPIPPTRTRLRERSPCDSG